MDDPRKDSPAGAATADLLRRAAPEITHDLNNLRAVLQGNLRIARKSARAGGREELAAPLEDVDLAFQQMVILIQGMLGLAREEPAPAAASLPLLPLLERVGALARWALPPRFEVAIAGGDREPLIRAEPELLQAALLNLALCSKHAAGSSGRVLFTVTGAPAGPGAADAGAFARLRVELPALATGDPESPAARRAALRHEFALALARRAVTECGGEVFCDGSAGEGSAVSLLLPLAAIDVGA
jgi:signal transduction histidine kinase